MMSLWIGCAEAPVTTEVPSGAELDASCGEETPCAAGLLCVNARCAEHPWYELPHDTQLADGWISPVIDTHEPVEDTTAPQDTLADTDTSSPTDAEGDVADIEDTSDTGTDSSELDVGEQVDLLITADDANKNPGSVTVVLKPGEAWVAGLKLPLSGEWSGIQFIAQTFSGTESCGRFRPAIWLPDATGAFTDEPTFVSKTLSEITGQATKQQLLVPDGPMLNPGKLRVGLIYDGPCTPGISSPRVITDKSGAIEDTWYWSPQPTEPPWVPGSFLKVQGRWALRLIITATI